MPKFKCSFSITTTVKKTYVVTNYEVDLPDDDCNNVDGSASSPQAIKDSISDEIYTAVGDGSLDPEDKGDLIEIDHNNGSPEFIKPPIEIDPISG